MNDISIGEMLKMQYELWDKNKDKWSPLEPETARNQFLWMIGEIGEALEIIKKCGEKRIMDDANVKAAFTEELCDIFMYFNGILLSYGISAEDMANSYTKKHERNMVRDYDTEEKNFADGL